MALVSVLVDSREPSWCKQLAFGGVPVVSTMLDAGDLLCACDDNALVAIERKEANDLLNTLRDDRLFPQLARLRDVTPWSYLLVCGQMQAGSGGMTFVNGVETGWNWASIQGALLTAQEIGVHVVHVASSHDYEAAVVRLGNRSRGMVHVAPAREMLAVSEGEAVLAAFPGVGPERAHALMDEFGDAHLALHYLTVWAKDWHCKPVPGVGDGTRRRVRKALGLDDALYLAAGVFETGSEDRKDETE